MKKKSISSNIITTFQKISDLKFMSFHQHYIEKHNGDSGMIYVFFDLLYALDKTAETFRDWTL